jgi:hypothetical protein
VWPQQIDGLRRRIKALRGPSMARKHKFLVFCHMTIPYSFADHEVQQQPDGKEGDLDPTEDALEAMAVKLVAHLRKEFKGIDRVRLATDSDFAVE